MNKGKRTIKSATLGDAFDNYLEISPILTDDLTVLMRAEGEAGAMRRNFLRCGSAMIEGYVAAIRDICEATWQEFSDSEKDRHLSAKEQKHLEENTYDSAPDYYKMTLRIAFHIWRLKPEPDFGGVGWKHAQHFFDRRNNLVHPKHAGHLEITDDEWESLHSGYVWICEQLFEFIRIWHEEYLSTID